LGSFDLALLRALRTHGHAPEVERAVLAFTRAGEHGGLWLALSAAGAVLDPGRRRVYLRTIKVVVIAYLLNIGLKYVIRRRRPELDDAPPLSSTVTSLSYPSAHATTSFAAARELARALPAPPLYAVATAMALSRPYVGVHYPTDVAAGAALGTALTELIP
jgi:undecaprenyl-diphosphatase